MKSCVGGPIGVEATGAVARAVMMMYDSIFQERVKEAGISLKYHGKVLQACLHLTVGLEVQPCNYAGMAGRLVVNQAI